MNTEQQQKKLHSNLTIPKKTCSCCLHSGKTVTALFFLYKLAISNEIHKLPHTLKHFLYDKQLT